MTAQAELHRRYAMARSVWQTSKAIRDAAALLSVTERGYCDAYVLRNYGPLPGDVAPDAERAYREARCQT